MKFAVDKNHDNMLLGNYLKKEVGMSRRLINKMKTSDKIYVNGEIAWTNHKLCFGDVVEASFPESNSENIIPEYINNIGIIYEDKDFLVLNKPPFIPSHPSRGHFTGTLANFVQWYYNKNNIKSAVRILGRLDKNTSGVTIICKNQYVQNLLSKSELQKEYLAVCNGCFKEKTGTINFPIKRSEDEIKREVSTDGKEAITKYEVIEEKEKYSLLRIKLVTGRTHQIRVHFSYLGHHLAGDELYGNDVSFHRQALHCHAIEIQNTGKKFEAPLYDDIKKFWDELN